MRLRRKKHAEQGKKALDIAEEAIHLLRTAPKPTLGLYYIGTLPFILALLYFWTDMLHNAFAYKQCAASALELALLFLWMKSWQSIFMYDLLASMRGTPTFPWSFGRVRRLVSIQTIIQPWGIVLLPIAMLAAIPFGWVYALFHNVTLFGDGSLEGSEVGAVLKRAWKQAKLWPKQNYLLIWLLSPWLLVIAVLLTLVLIPAIWSLHPGSPLIVLTYYSIFILIILPLNPLGIILAINIGATLFMLPFLAKTLFGIESIFTLSGPSSINSTFLAVVSGLTYICLDPVIKTVYALRCFYGESLHTGEDLKVALRHLLPKARVIIGIVMLLGITIAVPAHAANTSEPAVSAEALDESLDNIMARAEYAWRMPQDRETLEQRDEEPSGLLSNIYEAIKEWLRKISDWISKALDWIFDSLPNVTPQQRSSSRLSWFPKIQGLLYVLLAIIVCMLSILLWRIWKKRQRQQEAFKMEHISTVPDVRDEDVDARELPEEGWLKLAADLLENGQLRLALRAIYLATLSSLAQYELIRIARFKSDHEYARELQRRAHAHPQVIAVFAENMEVFERSWYGMYDITRPALQQFQTNHTTMRQLLAAMYPNINRTINQA